MPWTWRQPAWMAARLPATAVSTSLWVWMPSLLGRDLSRHLLDRARDLVRQAAAVGIAEHQPAGTSGRGRLETGLRIAGIGGVAVEEMLGIEHHFHAAPPGLGHAVLDHAQVLVERGAEQQDLTGRALADQGDDLGLGLEQGGQPRIVGGAAARPPGHPERRELGVLELRGLLEKTVVGRIGARPAALDVVDPELVEHEGDRDLVGDREVDALGLAAVAQGRVVEIDPFRHAA